MQDVVPAVDGKGAEYLLDLAGGTDEPGGPSRALSLSEVTRIVSERNPAIREALRRWEAAKQRVIQEGAWDDLRAARDLGKDY